MSESISKSVWVAKTNTFGKNTFTNVMLSDEKWYGLGGEFDVEDGDGISFDFIKTDKGYLNADAKTVKIFKGKGTKQPADKKKSGSTANAGKAKSGGGGSWKEQPDHVQIAIMAQSAQKAAVDTVIACLGADKLKLPSKKADHYDAIVGYTDALTDIMLAKTAGIMNKVKNGLSVADLINTVPVTVSTSITDDTAAVEAAEDSFSESDAAPSSNDGFQETADSDFVEA